MRLIDANALNSVEKEIVCGKTRSPYTKDYTAILRVFEVDEIRNAPTVDAVPVVHGRWILEREPNGKPYCFHCSVCDDDFHYIGIMSATDYCPNCGAKMDEVNE